eukprot:846334-Lingulodinium_polyedra.AAC.1
MAASPSLADGPLEDAVRGRWESASADESSDESCSGGPTGAAGAAASSSTGAGPAGTSDGLLEGAASSATPRPS